jgi:hypothetical protein
MWKKFIELSESLKIIFEGHAGFGYGNEDWHENHYNMFFSSDRLELGHISIIDFRETKGMWMMHVAAFAKPDIPMPIYGFDVVCGKNKVTGCFHDLSPTVHTTDHDKALDDYQVLVKHFIPERTRPLPDWAKQIVSDSMIAAGNIQNEKEASTLAYFGRENLNRWFFHLNQMSRIHDDEIIQHHELGKMKYCFNQLQNQNSKNVMVSLGLEEDYVERFKSVQFPY